jgi:hypothetical protein
MRRSDTWIAVVWMCVIGAAWHFLFEWTGRTLVVAPFAPVNESVWEHAKIAFWPAVVFLAFDPRRRMGWGAAWFATMLAALAGPLIMLGGFYAYTAVTPHGLWQDILLFVLSVSLAQWFASWAMSRARVTAVSLASVTALWLAYLVTQTAWTFAPPHAPPFRDARNGAYGVPLETRTAP